MSKWKCGICNSEFENYHAQDFDNIIYCPLCYYKELYKRDKKEIDRLNNVINKLEKDLKKRKDIYTNMNGSMNGVAVGCFIYVLDKLKELKDSDK